MIRLGASQVPSLQRGVGSGPDIPSTRTNGDVRPIEHSEGEYRTMHRSKRFSALALVAGLAITAAACGSDKKESGSTSASTTAAGATTTAAGAGTTAGGGSASSTPAGGSVDGSKVS